MTALSAGIANDGTTLREMWIPQRPTRFELASGAVAGTAGSALGRVLGEDVRATVNRYFPAPKSPGTAGDPGLFGPDSVIWRVHADMSLLVGGAAGVTMQGLHPRAFAGFADYTDFNSDPDGRLVRTMHYVMAVTYGSKREARSAIKHAHHMHERVKGVMPDGRTYDANEPELRRWVHLTSYAGAAAAYQRFGPTPLTPAELDQYIAESGVIGDEFGVDDPPRSWAEMDAALEEYRKILSINLRAARGISYFREPFGVPASVRRLSKALWPGSVACMPPYVQTLMMQWEASPTEVAFVRALVRGASAVAGDPAPLVRARARIAGA